MNCLYCEFNPAQHVDPTCLCDSCNMHLALGDLEVTDRPGSGRVIRWCDGDPVGPEGDAGSAYYSPPTMRSHGSTNPAACRSDY
jgi:hypothetical protein